MLDSDVDSLLDISIPNLFVDDYSNCRLRDVVDYAGLAVIDFEWHAIATSVWSIKRSCEIRGPFLHRAICFDVNNISNSAIRLGRIVVATKSSVPVDSEVCAQIDHTTLFEWAGKGILHELSTRQHFCQHVT